MQIFSPCNPNLTQVGGGNYPSSLLVFSPSGTLVDNPPGTPVLSYTGGTTHAFSIFPHGYSVRLV
jgi:hypothetical protein